MNPMLKNESAKYFRIDRRSIINEVHAAFAAEVCGAAELAPGTVLYTDLGLMNLTNHKEWSSWKMMTWNADEETTESRKGFSVGYYKFYVKSCNTIYAFNHVNDRFFRTIVDHLRESGDSHFIPSTTTKRRRLMRFKLIPKDEKLDRLAPCPRVSQALLDDLQQWSEASQCRKAKLQRQIIQNYLQNFSLTELERELEMAHERRITPGRYLQITRVCKSDLEALRERAEALELPKAVVVRLMMEAAVKRWKQSTSDERL